MEDLNALQKTNELIEKLLIVQLRSQGIGVKQIAKFVGKRAQTITELLKVIAPTAGER